MKIKYVTCSGANEETNISKLVHLMRKYPVGEIGIQVSGDKASKSMPRYDWILELAEVIKASEKPINAALHINTDWVEEFCDGFIAPELEKFISLKDKDDQPIFKRLQLNCLVGREKDFDVNKLMETMKFYPNNRFILSYNIKNADYINQIYAQKTIFDTLYDLSFGEGIKPTVRGPVVYPDRLQGYAGGLSPENIQEELNQISTVVPSDTEIYVDAQTHLMGKNKVFSISRAQKFIENSLKWQEEHA